MKTVESVEDRINKFDDRVNKMLEDVKTGKVNKTNTINSKPQETTKKEFIKKESVVPSDNHPKEASIFKERTEKSHEINDVNPRKKLVLLNENMRSEPYNFHKQGGKMFIIPTPDYAKEVKDIRKSEARQDLSYADIYKGHHLTYLDIKEPEEHAKKEFDELRKILTEIKHDPNCKYMHNEIDQHLKIINNAEKTLDRNLGLMGTVLKKIREVCQAIKKIFGQKAKDCTEEENKNKTKYLVKIDKVLNGLDIINLKVENSIRTR